MDAGQHWVGDLLEAWKEQLVGGALAVAILIFQIDTESFGLEK
jgi:hypothetical protein